MDNSLPIKSMNFKFINNNIIWKYIDAFKNTDQGIRYKGIMKIPITSIPELENKGNSQFFIDIESEATIKDLKNLLKKRYPDLYPNNNNLIFIFDSSTKGTLYNYNDSTFIKDIPNFVKSINLFVTIKPDKLKIDRYKKELSNKNKLINDIEYQLEKKNYEIMKFKKKGNLYSIIFPDSKKKIMRFSNYNDACKYIENECGYIYYTKNGNEIKLIDHKGDIKIKLSCLDGNKLEIDLNVNSNVDDLMNAIEKIDKKKYPKNRQYIFKGDTNICNLKEKLVKDLALDDDKQEIILIIRSAPY